MSWLQAFLGGFDVARAMSSDAFLAASELAMVLPAAVLATVPFLDRLRCSRLRCTVFLGILFFALMALAPVLAGFAVSSNTVLIPAIVILFAVYARTIDAPLSKKAGVYCSVAMLSAFITYAALIVDTFLDGGDANYLAWPGFCTQWGLWIIAVALLVRPMRSRLPSILNAPIAGKRFWGTFWIFPFAMTCALLALVPNDVSTLLYRRVGLAAVIGVTALFALTALSYVLLIRLSIQASEVFMAQQRENALSLQLLMQSHLETRIEDARRARHDGRQHDRAIRGFLDAGDLNGLSTYLDAHEAHATDLAPLRVCENAAVNAVAVYYWDAALRLGASVDMDLDVPRHADIDDDDLTVLLGNLLENAVEALQRVKEGRLAVRIWRDRQGAFFIRVTNSCKTACVITKDGIVSTKHAGTGIGTASVRAIAEANRGTASFACEGGVFTADVMLGG